MKDLQTLFERITTVPKVRSINGVFIAIDNTLEDTNYEPAYQRNYVWDDEKATFFIETIFLGSEVPPIILFKSSLENGFIHYEVIDGRQRYQTILRFLKGELKLKKSGLQKLGEMEDFAGKSFFELSTKYQNLFKDTKIRTIEYSFIGSYTQEEEESVKREIFQRYNSGISPLKSFELDRARYYYNDFNQSIKELLEDDSLLNTKVTDVFLWEKLNIEQKVAKIRELLVLHRIPIKYYANKKQTIIDKYFEYMSSQLDEDVNVVLDSFREKIDILSKVMSRFKDEQISYNRLYAECLFWALCVMEQNQIEYDLKNEITLSNLMVFFKDHSSDFTTIRSSFSRVLVGRYQCMANFFEKEYNCSFNSAIENEDGFKLINKYLPTSINSLNDTIEAHSFEELRINKPEPTSVELTELLSDLKSNCFILRPSYQRGDVKNKKKSSSIIESMLLGVMLPPIFVFKRKNGISEVIDGQQRLLSIISYIGETYKDENGIEQKPLLHNFKLDLGESAVLKKLRGFAYKDLTKLDQNKIRKTSIFIIEIREDQNPNFDPVDLFVRLNNKPYPIPYDSFEMWNSLAPQSIIQLVKNIVKSHNGWFYLRKNNSRMDNENLFATLVYFQHQYKKFGINIGEVAPDKTIELYLIDNRIALRFRSRGEITKLMYDSDWKDLQSTINTLDFSFVSNIYELLNGVECNKSELNKEMDVLIAAEHGKRTQISFYILWVLLHDLPCDIISKNRELIKSEIVRICKMLNVCHSLAEFKEAIFEFRKKFGRDYSSMRFSLGSVVSECDSLSSTDIIIKKMPSEDNRLDVKVSNQVPTGDNLLYLKLTRSGFELDFVVAFLRSRLFYHSYSLKKGNLSINTVCESSAPYVSIDIQRLFSKVLSYIDNADVTMKGYFERILDLMFYELYFAGVFKERNIHILEEISKYQEISNLQLEHERHQVVKNIYTEQTQTSNAMSTYLIKAVDIDLIKKIEKFID